MTALDWDAWRDTYAASTYQEQQDFHTQIHQRYPEQRHYDPLFVAQAIEQTQPRTIVELGGWDGELAQHMLEQYPTIERWTNIELCREAAQAGHDRHPNYHAPLLNDWYWNHGPWTCDLFVSSHSVEHLTTQHLNETLAATNTNALYFDAPLQDHALNWQGFTGTHILETGWHGITQLCANHGYTLNWAQDHHTDPASGGHARACLYTRGPSK